MSSHLYLPIKTKQTTYLEHLPLKQQLRSPGSQNRNLTKPTLVLLPGVERVKCIFFDGQKTCPQRLGRQGERVGGEEKRSTYIRRVKVAAKGVALNCKHKKKEEEEKKTC